MENKDIKPKGYWTFERCLEESLKYKTRTDFQKYSKNAYQAASNLDIIDDICEHMGDKKYRKSKYTYDICKEEALKYNTKKEFKNNCSGIYKYAYRTNILNDICSHMISNENNPSGYWTYEKCKEITLLCNTRKELYENYNGAYKRILNSGWLDEMCQHMIEKQKPSGYWTYGKCKEDALNYTTKIEYLSNSSSYDTSYKNGWLDDICSHMIENKKPNGYWSFERCKEECLKYESKSEFRKNNVSAYSTSKKNKWLDDICSHMIENRKPSGYWTFERCKEEALKYNTKEEFKENNQGAYSRTYKNNWQNEICSHMEKIRKNVDYYTYDICKELSKKCKNKNEYNSLSSSAYNISIENGWINEFFPKSKITWTDILCEIEAKKYNNLNEFKENSHGAYKYSKRVGIFEKISEHFIKKTPKEYWDYQKCKNIALSCKNLLDFELNHNCAYSSSIKNDWYNDITKHLCFDFKKCQEEALKYNSITQFKQNSKIIYNYAKNNNFLNDITKHMKKIIWNKELILEEAKKYTTKKDFEKYSNRAFREMRKLNIVLETCSHMTDNNLSKNYWTKEKCQEISLKYTNRTHFRKNEPGVVRMSIKLGVYDEICSHMITLKKLKGYWTKEKCQVIALKYTNKSDFNKNDGAAVAAMYKNNWLDICSHMILNENNKPRCIYAYEFEDNSVYIGLTCNLNDRKRRHKTNGTVFEYIQKTNSKYNIIQLTDYIEQTESQIKEKEYTEKYKNDNWIILNKIKTGSLGSNTVFWTKEKCSKEALNYDTRTKFQNGNRGAYLRAYRNGWLDEICSHMKKTKR